MFIGGDKTAGKCRKVSAGAPVLLLFPASPAGTTENYTDISLTRAADSRHWLSVTDSVTHSS